MIEKKAPPPAIEYWAYPGPEPFWMVRSPRHEYPDSAPAYVAKSLEDLLFWMRVKKIDRMELRLRDAEGVVIHWLLIREKRLTPGEGKTEKARAGVSKTATKSR